MTKHAHQGGNAVYALGLIGAVIYFVTHAATFWAGVLGVLKAIVWPAFLVYYAFRFFSARIFMVFFERNHSSREWLYK